MPRYSSYCIFCSLVRHSSSPATLYMSIACKSHTLCKERAYSSMPQSFSYSSLHANSYMSPLWFISSTSAACPGLILSVVSHFCMPICISMPYVSKVCVCAWVRACMCSACFEWGLWFPVFSLKRGTMALHCATCTSKSLIKGCGHGAN